MAGYAESINRDASDDPLVPTPVAAEVIKELPAASAVLTNARKVPMSSKTWRQPALSVLPEAYFVTGDTGLKQTSSADWENVELVAEEIAVLVPVPEAYFDDSQVPIWDEVRPLMVEAFGRKIDAACLFGTSKPATWGDAIVTTAISQGNTVTEGANEDLAVDVAETARKLALDGVSVNAFATGPGFRWRLIGLRSTDGIPIYAPPAGPQPATLFGYPLPEVQNGAWDESVATLLAGDWRKAIVGTRQDISFRVFTEGVISDADGAVVLNLMQQDSIVLRAVMRMAWAVANPVNPVNDDSATRYPFSVLVPAGS